MTATVVPPAPAVEAIPPSAQWVSVFADLMPEEIVDARRVNRLKRKLAVGLAALLVLIVAGYALSFVQTSSAKHRLAAAQSTATTLQRQEQQYVQVSQIQGQASAIKMQLAQVMAGDLPWSALLTTLNGAAPAGVHLTSITATMNNGSATSGSATIPSTPSAGAGSGIGSARPVGTITLAGSATSKAAVATFMDKLAAVKVLSGAFPSGISSQGGAATFTATVTITADALGGRFTAQKGH